MTYYDWEREFDHPAAPTRGRVALGCAVLGLSVVALYLVVWGAAKMVRHLWG